MFTNLTNSAKAIRFFMIAFGLTVTISLLYPLLGEITPLIHMYTPTLLALEYLAGETGVLTLVATALSAAVLLYHLRYRRSTLTVHVLAGV